MTGINKYFEMSEAPRPDGRRRIKVVLHEIYPNTSYHNINGICYLERYTKANAESIIGMPLCATFLDSYKDIPYDHGHTGNDGNMPLYENSVQVGVCDDWSIEDLVIDGKTKRVCCGIGYINEQRYPRFVQWLEEQRELGIQVYGSVELVSNKKNHDIIYDGGYRKEGRIPMEYTYGGYCILSVKPADNSAILVELNQINNPNKESEDSNFMDEKTLCKFVEDVKSTIVEINSKNTDYESKIKELNEKLAEKEKQIEELNAKCKIAEDNAAKKEEEVTETNAACEATKKELNELKKESRINELNSSLSGYTDEEKECAKDQIASFNSDPLSVEINSIVSTINAAIGEKIKCSRTVEMNSKKEHEIDDIYSDITNYETPTEIYDFDNIFN